MERKVLENVLELLNKAVESNSCTYLSSGVYEQLGEHITPRLQYYEYEDDKIINNIIKLLRKIKSQLDDKDKDYFMKELCDELKIFIQDDETKITFLSENNGNYKESIVGCNVDYRMKIIGTIDDDQMKMTLLDNMEFSDEEKAIIVNSINNQHLRISALDKLKSNELKTYVITQLSKDIILEHIEEIMLHKGITNEIEKKTEKLKKMLNINPYLFKTFHHWELLDDKFDDLFEDSKMSLIMTYPESQIKLLSLGEQPKKLELIKQIFKNVPSEDDQYFAIKLEKILSIVLTKKKTIMRRGEEETSFQKLIENIDIDELTTTDFEQLAKILSYPNLFNIQTIDDVRNFNEIKARVCEAMVNRDYDVLDKYPALRRNEQFIKIAVLQKLYGQDKETTENILRLFGEDIDNLPDLEPEVQYVKSLKIIMETEDEELLRAFYNLERSAIRVYRSVINGSETKTFIWQRI